MQNFRINFSHPWLLLLLIPAIALTLFPYFRADKKYRKTRNRILSMLFHGLAMVLAITLLAGITFSYEKPNLENELIILVDNTDSNEENADAKSDFISSIVAIADGKYRLGIVKFGHGQVLSGEMGYETTKALEDYLTSDLPDTTATDIASALKYARSLFKNPETSKIVLVSDGIETDNAALTVIKAIAADGVKVDTVCYPNEEKDEIQIYSVKTPETRIIPGDNFITQITLRSNFVGEKEATITAYDNDNLIGSTSVTLENKEQTFDVALSLNERGMHEIRFEIKCEGDTLEQNNSYRVYINLEAFDNVLLIEHKEGEGKRLAEILNETFVVTDLSLSDDLAEMPRTIEQMAKYEQIILVNVAYSDMPAGFEELLNEYVYNLGGGLFTVGGELDEINGVQVPHAYNRNDIASSTYFKQMLPINAIDYTPPIAVMIVVDASASMSMGKLEAAKEGAVSCLDGLNDRDFCGVMSFQTRASEELAILPASQRDLIRETIEKIGGEDDSGASGGTIFSDAIMRAGRALSVINNVERKHIILVTDGNPGDTYDTYLPYIQDNFADEITMSIVTINNQDNSLSEQMSKAAAEGGGKYYNILPSEMQKIPEIMQQDLALEAVAEINYGELFSLSIKDRTAAVAGIDEALIPQLSGYYGTVAKKDASVPLMGKYVPIYAEWKYGKGSVGSFMCDLSGIWSDTFMSDLVGKTIITNIVNSLFPIEDVRADGIDYVIKSDNYHYQISVHGVLETEKIEVFVTPISDHLISILDEGVSVKALESNRRFNFIIKDAGLYEIAIKKYDQTGAEIASVVTYEAFSYSEEYNSFTERLPIGEELMTLLATDGKGMVVTDPAEVFESFSETIKKVYDPRVIFLILAIIFVLLDIAARKFKFKWPHEIIREYKQKKADEAAKNG